MVLLDEAAATDDVTDFWDSVINVEVLLDCNIEDYVTTAACRYCVAL